MYTYIIIYNYYIPCNKTIQEKTLQENFFKVVVLQFPGTLPWNQLSLYWAKNLPVASTWSPPWLWHCLQMELSSTWLVCFLSQLATAGPWEGGVTQFLRAADSVLCFRLEQGYSALPSSCSVDHLWLLWSNWSECVCEKALQMVSYCTCHHWSLQDARWREQYHYSKR